MASVRTRTAGRRVVVSLGVLLVAAAAFRLSFDAQATLATAAGADPSLAWIYPLTVDAAIATVTLIAMWGDDLRRQTRAYLWFSLGLWTAASVAGNALHILALPAGRLSVPFGIAVAVNTVPAVSLFLIIHIASSTVFRRDSPRATGPSRSAAPNAVHTAVRGNVDNARLVELAASGLSYQAIAVEVGRSKSWVGERMKSVKTAQARE